MRERGEGHFACSQCNHSFADNAHLRSHQVGSLFQPNCQLSHSKAKPFACDTCPKRYSRMSTLREHRVVHDRWSGAVASNPRIQRLLHLSSSELRKTPSVLLGIHQPREEALLQRPTQVPSSIPLHSSWDINRAVNVILKSFIKRYTIGIECNRVYWYASSRTLPSSHSIRTHWKQNLQTIRELNETIAQLEDELDSEDETSPVVLPAAYLSSPTPYECGVEACHRRFPSYEALTAHASQHPGVSLRSLRIPPPP